ncbi:hypothetical protein PHISCL_02797 [Aspergillus sclerotialis]|uniref:Uncharacterized protein n=1 Tax=Aspergillus sclerotialis TaxID=2070753 RepID=A0A3A2ZRA3_9EURO|nr:hypothetical protein PHISCL_02797 [Aspergillus sclerotialis]
MLACHTPTDHYGCGWSGHELSHGTGNLPSYHEVSHNPITQRDYSPPRKAWTRSQSHSPPSSISSSTARPEQSEYTTLRSRRLAAEHTPLSISPFRSVQRMKRPFQLRLPASPKSPTATEEKESRASPRSMGLRSWRSDQNLMATSLDAFGILPSPPLSDSRLSKTSPSSPCSPSVGRFPSADNSETSEGCDSKQEDEPCDPLDPKQEDTLVEEDQTPCESINVHMVHSSLVNRETNESHSRVSSNAEHTTTATATQPTASEKETVPDSSTEEQRARAGTESSDTSWLPSNLSYCETWLQGVPVEMMDAGGLNSKDEFANRRKFQIIQKSPPPSVESFDVMASNEPVRFAVASKAKPKLVDISPRPQSVMSNSTRSPSLKDKHPVPCTPDQRQQEVSAFSPDTPSERVDSGYVARNSYTSRDGDYVDDGYCTETSSMSLGSANSTVIGQKSSKSNDSPCLQSEETINAITTPLQKPNSPPRVSSTMSEREQLEKWWDHEWTLDQLDHSVRDFPRNMLRLTSPVIMFLRQSNEKALIRPFRKIFPLVSESLLDCLCAALIAHNYIVSLSPNRGSTTSRHNSNLSGLEIIPEKASATLGIQSFHGPPAHFREKILSTRGAELQKDLGMIVDYLLFAICGRSDDTLKSAVLVLIQVLEAKI